jgi:aryl-alcohol dehydrogenase-like predicted oxidoreductase
MYNLVAREIEQDMLPLAVKRNVAVITYSPLGAGFLSGKYLPGQELIPRGSRFDVKPGHRDIYFKPENFRLLEKLRSKALSSGLPMVRLALDWVFRNPSVTSVLVGARSIEQVSNALEACAMPLPIELHADMNGWLR